MFYAFVLVATTLTYVLAQSQCEGTLETISADPAASSCLSTPQMFPLVSASQNSESLIPSISHWLTSICGQPVCNNDTVNAVYKLVTANCPVYFWGDFESWYYPTWRKAICLKRENGSLCMTEFLTEIESYSGRLTFDDFERLGRNGIPASIPTNITCTDYVKAGYNIVVGDIPSIADHAKPSLAARCGTAFVDGQMPTGIIRGENSATATAITMLDSLALSIFSQIPVMGLTASALIVISTLYTILT